MARKSNYGAGPAQLSEKNCKFMIYGLENEQRKLGVSGRLLQLPEAVLKKAQAEFLDYGGLGLSITEISHRSKDFEKILTDAEALLRELMHVPDDYAVLFMHGGGTGQFAAVPMNIAAAAADGKRRTADYIVTGGWSEKAAKEAKKYVDVNTAAKSAAYTHIPPIAEWQLSADAAYVYICANETVHGVEFAETPALPANTQLVADISSNILSRAIDVSKYAILYAGTQKNLGISGLTIVIVKKSLIGNENAHTPGVLSYATIHKDKSLYNTPCCFGVYMTKLFLEWIKEQGGVEAMEANAKTKSQMIYDAIDASNGFYVCPVDKASRSRMNVPFRVRSDPALEAKFVAEAAADSMIGLKGHRSVGGIRASLYNAVSVEETRKLLAFMQRFQQANA